MASTPLLPPSPAEIAAPGPSQGHFRLQAGGVTGAIGGPADADQTAKPPAAPALSRPGASQPLVFRAHAVIDQQGFGYEVFRMLIPKDWVFAGGLAWDFAKIPPDAKIAYTASSPDGNSVFEKTAAMTYMWSQDPNMNYTYAQSGTAVMQTQGAAEFLQNFYIPRARSAVSAIKVVETQPLPGLAQYMLAIGNMQLNIFHQISPPNTQLETRADSARVKIEYAWKGRQMIEDFTCTITYVIAYTPTMYGQTALVNWVAQVESFRAPAEEMPSKIRLFQTMIYSRVDNPVWSVNNIRLAAVINREQLRHQQAIFARLRQIRETQSEISDMIWETYQNKSQAQDRMFESYTQALRGVETYVDPVNSRNVELPSGFGNVWTNGSDYILSDSPTYNPNAAGAGGGTWTQMNRKR
ncbi:MAG: hypothetical protein HGA24_06430 [Candidatus Aminicenantes bacterium]|nr:hypothetical protein [Candidatus Aminicenantes bacterium]